MFKHKDKNLLIIYRTKSVQDISKTLKPTKMVFRKHNEITYHIQINN